MALKNRYKINARKIKTLKDVRVLFEKMEMTFVPENSTDFEEIKHLLILPGVSEKKPDSNA